MHCASVLDVVLAAENVTDGVSPLLLKQMREPQLVPKRSDGMEPYAGACGVPAPEMLAALIVCSRRTRMAARDCGGQGDPDLERIDGLSDMVVAKILIGCVGPDLWIWWLEVGFVEASEDSKCCTDNESGRAEVEEGRGKRRVDRNI